ncbi:MAG: hypothetical protein MJ185_12010 [Treponema sp.]|nr:hypothetical protein [Treponema sp.]
MKKFSIVISIFILTMSLSAQSADAVTDILNAEKITMGQACYLSAVFQGFASDDTSFEDSMLALVGQGQLSEITEPSEPATIARLSEIYAKMFDVKGGLFFRLSGGSPRYAFKHLKAKGLIPQNTDPSKVLSGREAMSLFTKVSMRYGEPQFTDEL